MSDERDHLLERDHRVARPDRERSGAPQGIGAQVIAAAGESSSLAGALRSADRATRADTAFHVASAQGNRAVQRLVAQAVQREAAMPEEEEEDTSAMVQARADVGLEGGPVPDDVAQRIDGQRGGGAPLGDGVQREMETSFGASFADVRVHTGSESDDLNARLHAKAFTTGSDVFVRSDQPSADTAAGKELMAHELAHVVQQRSMPASGPMTVGPAGDHQEVAADHAAAAAMAQRDVDEDTAPAATEDVVSRELAPEDEVKEDEMV